MTRPLLSFVLLCVVNLCSAQTITTPNLKLKEPPVGSAGWGPEVNADFSILDFAVGSLLAPYQGLWSASHSYSAGQFVTYQGTLYLATTASLNSTPGAMGAPWITTSSVGTQATFTTYGSVLINTPLVPGTSVAENTLNQGQPGGYPYLDGAGAIPSKFLPPANTGFAGTAAGISSDGTTGSDSGISESFYADMVCYPTTTTTGTGSTATTTTTYSTPQGWDYASGHSCLQGFVQPFTSGMFMSLARSMQFTGGDQPQASQFTVQARVKYYAGSNVGASIGFNAAPEKTVSTNASQHVLLTLTSNGWVLDNQGTITQLQPANGTTSGTPGTTDSGVNPSGGNYGWNAQANGTYDVTLMIPGDGSIIASMVALGSPQNSVSFRLVNQTLPTCASPCGTRGAAAGLQNLEVDAFGGADRIGEVAYSIGGPRTVSYDLPHRSGYYNVAAMLRFPAAGNVWAWVPPGYQRNSPNKWVIVNHGYNETSQVVQTEYLQVTNLLMQQGYVIVALDNTTPNCYGNAQCVTDMRTTLATVRAALSLAPQPYFMADSMGGFEALNAITEGGIIPKALVGFCINTNMAWDYTSGGASTPINADYSISAGNPYAAATAGYDPMLVTGSPLNRLLAVPMLLFSSPNDTVVLKSQNTDPFAAKLNAAGGNVTVISTTGNHLDQSNFNGPAVMSFLSTH